MSYCGLCHVVRLVPSASANAPSALGQRRELSDRDARSAPNGLESMLHNAGSELVGFQ